MCGMPSDDTIIVCLLHGPANVTALVGWVIHSHNSIASQQGGAYSLQFLVLLVYLSKYLMAGQA